MSLFRKKPPPRPEIGDTLNEFIAKEQPSELLVDEKVYRNVASPGGGVAEWMTMGHREMRWRDKGGRWCIACSTPRCSGIFRWPKRPDHWDMYDEKAEERT